MSDLRHTALKKDISLENPLFKKQQSTNNKKKPHVNVVILENIEKYSSCKIPDHIPLDFTE